MTGHWPRAREGRVPGGEPRGVAGLDTASDRFHLVWVEHQGAALQTKFARMAGHPDDRRRVLFEEARAALGQLPAGCRVFCEEPLAMPRNGATTRSLGLAAGAIWAAHLELDVFWFWVPVSSWKKAIIGNGGANKVMVAAYLKDRYLLDFDDEPDFYDAFALMHYGLKELA